jgi:hypothetical protein
VVIELFYLNVAPDISCHHHHNHHAASSPYIHQLLVQDDKEDGAYGVYCAFWHHNLGSQHCGAVVGSGLGAFLYVLLAEHFGCDDVEEEEEEVAVAALVQSTCLDSVYLAA